MDKIEIEFIPEDTGAPYEADMTEPAISDIPAHVADKICKRKFGHTNWARVDKLTPAELAGNPCEFDHENGVVYFKNAYLV